MSGLLNKLTDECGHIIPSSPFEFGIRGAKTAVQTTMVVICAGCERPILDRFLLNVLDRAWHSKCVQCFDCKANLTEKCFSRDGKLYCREDFFRRFGTKCGGCSQGISPNDLVRRARNKVFHLKCFTCMVCRKQLSTGEELYVLDENKFICKEDYIQSKYQGSDVEDDNDMDFDQAMLDKMDDAMSDKTSTSLHDDDSIDSAIPLSNGLHANGPSPGNLSNGTTLPGAGMSSPIGANASNLGPLPDLAHERNNNSDIIIKKEKKSPAPKDGSRSVSGDSSDASSVDTNTKDGVEKDDKEKNNNKENSSKEDGTGPTGGTKRRGPRTTIKAKQLETLKAAFAATPKPTRHIREQLAQETGLNMRVIQVWFQNRRSKERRMKQLSALGARRQFFRNPRRLRALRPGEDLDSPDMMGQPGFNYFENGEFYPGYPGYEYFPQPGEMSFLPPNSGPPGNPPMVDQPVPGQMPPGHPDAHYLPSEMGHLPPTSSPEPHIGSMHPDAHPFIPGSLPPRSMPGNFGQTMPHPQQEMAQETW